MKKYILLVCIVACWGCSDWLNVQPSDRIAEQTAFPRLRVSNKL